MIVKGIVSAVNTEANTVDVILPEYGDIVTCPTKVYGMETVKYLSVNEFVLVVVFNDDFNDCMILQPFTTNGSNNQSQESVTESGDSISLKDKTTGTEYEIFVDNGQLKMEESEADQ